MDLLNLLDLSRYPWPALLVAEGEVVGATAAMYGLLGIEPPAAIAELCDFEDAHGQPLRAEQLPWRRLARGEAVEEHQVWVCRRSGRRLAVKVHAGAPNPLITVFDDSAQARRLELSRLPGLVASVLLQVQDAREAAAEVVRAIHRTLNEGFVCLVLAAEERLVLRACAGLDDEQVKRLSAAIDCPAAAAACPEACSFERLGEPSEDAWKHGLFMLGARSAVVSPLAIEETTAHRILVGLGGPTAPSEVHHGLREACEVWALWSQRERGGSAERRARTGMRALAEAALRRESKLPLRDLLRLLVDQACDLTGAQYGALGVLNKEHTELEDFITSGVSDEQAARIGHLPTGKGLLGAVIREARTIRVGDMRRDPRAQGFPPHHPPMKSFLGVPLRVGAEIYGNFYLTDKRSGEDFTEEDARLLEAFSAQAALTVSYARDSAAQRRVLDAVLVQAPHGILFFSDERQIAFSNAAAEALLGVRQALTSPGPPYALLLPDGRRLEDAEYPSARALRGEVVTNLEVRIQRARGDLIPAFVNAAPVQSETGARLGAVVVFQDITPFKELERAREEFAAIVAHDLRSPLQAMLLPITQLLRGQQSDPIPVPSASLERMRRSGERLTHLISDLLDASRIEGRRLHLSPKPVGLSEVLSALVPQLEPALGGHVVQVQERGTPPPVLADVLRLEQVLTNLLENAAKYSAPGSPIEITIAADAGGARVSIRDRGPGIHPEDQPRLFDRYFQAKRAREKKTGLGLGLYITKGLVDAHEGRLWVESAPGAGSTFHVWLPGAAPVPP